MKLFNKTIKILLMILLLVTTCIGNWIPPVQAATFPIESAYLYSKGSYGNMIRYNGVELLTTFVVYQKDGVEYPAYCMDVTAPGVGEMGSYTTTVSSYLNSASVWRVITNGYPYKTASQLGCNSDAEAFVATKQAVYCILYGRDPNSYEAIGAQGVRVKNAIIEMVRIAKSTTGGKPSSNIEIKADSSEWKRDSIWTDCVSQTFSISASTTYNTYQVKLEGTYPAETKIVSEGNQSKTTFSSGEKFKVIMPLKSMNKAGNFTIHVSTKLNTKPILYGRAPNAGYQDYALTGASFEDAEGTKTISYYKNETKLQILKKEDETQKPLKGVEFRILDASRNPIYTDLVTDEQGSVVLTNLLPGRYYLEEIKTQEGYAKYEGLIEFDLALNQTLTITVKNSLEKKTEISTNTQDMTVEQSRQELSVSRHEEYSSRTQNQNSQSQSLDVSINHQNQNSNAQSQNMNVNVNNQNQNANVQNQNNNVNVNNQNQNTNVQNQNNNANVNNQNQNANVQNQNNNANVNNQNQNANVQNQNNNVNVNNQNQNSNVQNQNSNVNSNNQNQTIRAKTGVVKLPKTGM